MSILRNLARRRAERRKAQRQRAIMLDMMRELNAMARDGLLAPEGER